jgi:GntR family transcriptional repressor for pyruvate dehydrogenase complex
MKIRLKPINPKRISDQVFDQLRELIFRGDFQPGDKIMTERELAEALNVSRNSVREAINKLVTLRFLEQRQGQGTFVRSMDEAVKILWPRSWRPRMRASSTCWKCVWESSAMPLLWRPSGRTATDLEAIEKAIGEMDTDTRAGGLGTEGDLSFHMAIAMATKNPLQVYIMKNVSDFLHFGIRENLLHLYQDPDNIVEILRQHQAIYHAIRRGDAESAYRTMRNHITFVIRFFKNRE